MYVKGLRLKIFIAITSHASFCHLLFSSASVSSSVQQETSTRAMFEMLLIALCMIYKGWPGAWDRMAALWMLKGLGVWPLSFHQSSSVLCTGQAGVP